MKKRIISLIAAIATTASMLTALSPIASAKAYPKPEEAVAVLQKLDIVSTKYSEETPAPVSRIDFAAAVANAINVTETSGVRFLDVDIDNANTGKLNGLYDMGIISGYDRHFNPNDNITGIQAATIIMNALGRTYYSENGAAFDCMSMARELDIIKSNVGRNDEITVGQMYQMIYQMMQVSTMQVSGIVNGNVAMKDTGDNMFKLYHDTVIEDAYIEGVYGTCLGTEVNLESNEIAIGGEAYVLDYAVESSEILGRNMRVVYVEDENGIKTVIYMTPCKDNEEEVVIVDDDYIGFDFSSYTISYYINGTREKTADIDRGASFIYNGQNVKENVSDMMATIDPNYDNVTVTLRDSDGNGSFDLVIIDKYINVYVKSVDKTNYFVVGKNAGADVTVVADPAKVDYIKMVNNTGEELEFSEITAGTIASAYVSLDKKHVRLMISNQTVSGNITEHDNEEYTMTVDEEQYTVDAACVKADCQNIKKDVTYTLYLDQNGKIARIELEKSDAKIFAYMMKAEKVSGTDDKVVLKLLVQDGTIGEYNLADKVKIDGVMYKNELAEDIIPKLGTTQIVGEKNKPIQQIIRIRLNSDNEITWIDTAKAGENESSEDALVATSDPYAAYSRYNATQKRFGLITKVDANTIIFKVPKVDVNGNLLDSKGLKIGTRPTDADYTVKKVTDLGTGDYYNFYGYRTDKDAVIQDAVVWSPTVLSYTAQANSNIYMVKKIKTVLDADDEAVTEITTFGSGGENKFTTYSNSLLNEIKVGDIVEFSVDSNYVAGGVVKYFDYTNQVLGWSGRDHYTSNQLHFTEFQVTQGWVSDNDGGIVCISYDENDKNKVSEVLDLSTATVAVYDPSLGKEAFYVGDAGDITLRSRIFVHTRIGAVVDVIVYK